MKNKKIIIFLIFTVLTSFISYKAGKNSAGISSVSDFDDYGSFSPFIKTIKDNYYFEVDEEKMQEEVKKAIFSSLGDPYSQYMTEQDMKDLKRVNSGKFIGVGVQVTIKENGEVTVISPIKGGPSERAGILPDDVIVKIDDKEVPKNDLEATVKLMRGDEKEGSAVKVTVKRIVNGNEEYKDFNLQREEIKTETIHSEILNENILYISITNFGETTGIDFEKAVDDGISKGAKAMIIDVRNNPGGLLTSVVATADKILPEGVIMKIVDSKKNEEITKSTGEGLDIPIVVLINKGSASASEVLSVALKDNGKATLVGEKSFGKGIIQNILPLTNKGKLEGVKLTIAEYFGPKGTVIHKKGLTPDVEIEQDPAKIGIKHLKEDMQLQKSLEILKEKINK